MMNISLGLKQWNSGKECFFFYNAIKIAEEV